VELIEVWRGWQEVLLRGYEGLDCSIEPVGLCFLISFHADNLAMGTHSAGCHQQQPGASFLRRPCSANSYFHMDGTAGV
jgi:hypothetical protein